MTVRLPDAEPVIVTEHVPAERLQLLGLRDPGPVDVNVTIPPGAMP